MPKRLKKVVLWLGCALSPSKPFLNSHSKRRTTTVHSGLVAPCQVGLCSRVKWLYAVPDCDCFVSVVFMCMYVCVLCGFLWLAVSYTHPLQISSLDVFLWWFRIGKLENCLTLRSMLFKHWRWTVIIIWDNQFDFHTYCYSVLAEMWKPTCFLMVTENNTFFSPGTIHLILMLNIRNKRVTH